MAYYSGEAGKLRLLPIGGRASMPEQRKKARWPTTVAKLGSFASYIKQTKSASN
ncbi:MAG: hypothetical protein IJR26_06835 [Bacteroidales bacterium]|nr:hypothetical protein [Bacteroidales bacterium]